MDVVGQIIGFIYLGFFIASFQFKDKKMLMNLRMFSKIFASIHYLLIGATAGFISQFIGIFPNYYAYKYDNDKRKIFVAFLFIVLFTVFGIITYESIYDVLPIIGSILTIYYMFKRGTKYIRTSQFVISPMFLVYNIVNLSYAGIITEILVLISCIIGTIRLDKKTT